MEPTPTAPFPPHWLVLARNGTHVAASLVPCSMMAVQATEWHTCELRDGEYPYILEELAKRGERSALVLDYVNNLDQAHHYMISWGVYLRHQLTAEMRAELFAPSPPVPMTDNAQPAEPLPAGHPDSFSMDELKHQLEASSGGNPS